MTKEVFVISADEFNLGRLRELEETEPYRFHPLTTYEETLGENALGFNDLVELAKTRLKESAHSPDAFLHFWDFPASCLSYYLSTEYGLPSPPLESVAKCEHKYWARKTQEEVIPNHVPRTQAIDPFADDPAGQLELDFPFWLKPVKAMSSRLGTRVENREEFDRAIKRIREGIREYGDPFNEFLQKIDLPPEIEGIGGNHCVAEELISKGDQCTVSGFVHNGRVQCYGVVDSVNYAHASSFFRYQYPSRLPAKTQTDLYKVSEKIISHIGYDNAAFNIEFFVRPEDDYISLLEINSRISQSHADLYKKVDGLTNLKVSIDLALGKQPDIPHRKGDFGCAGKFFLRRFHDGKVLHAPSKEDLEKISELIPGTIVIWHPEEGTVLSRLPHEDSYSAELAIMYMGADDTEELLQKFVRAVDLLPYSVEPYSKDLKDVR